MSLILDGTTGVPVTTVTGTLPVANGGTGVATKTGTGAVVLGTSPTLTTPVFNSATFATVSGTAPIYGCRAWCTFNGTTAGTNAPASGGNVTTVTRNSTGSYSVNLTTAMSDALYSTQCITSRSAGGWAYLGASTSSTVNFNVYNSAGTLVDADQINVAVFR